jgi:hypothetical protein
MGAVDHIDVLFLFCSIIDLVRDNITTDLKRDDMLTKEDIKNIKHSYNIHLKDGYHNKHVACSVALRVEEWKKSEQNLILFFKRRDELTSVCDLRKEDFCLIFMNHTQRELLKKFGNKIICLDSTHGLNRIWSGVSNGIHVYQLQRQIYK